MRSIDLRAVTLTIALLSGVVLAGVGLAEPPDRGGDFGDFAGRPHDRGPERFLEEHADDLGLSAETREAIQKIISDSRDRADALREDARDDAEKMRSLLQQPMPDEKQVMKLTESTSEHRLAQSKNRMRAMLDIRKLLTEEQRAKLVEIREARRGGRALLGPMRACRSELRDVCPDAEPGRETLQCLSEKWDELSEECRGSFEGHGRRGFWQHQRGEAPED